MARLKVRLHTKKKKEKSVPSKNRLQIFLFLYGPKNRLQIFLFLFSKKQKTDFSGNSQTLTKTDFSVLRALKTEKSVKRPKNVPKKPSVNASLERKMKVVAAFLPFADICNCWYQGIGFQLQFEQ